MPRYSDVIILDISSDIATIKATQNKYILFNYIHLVQDEPFLKDFLLKLKIQDTIKSG